MEKLANSPPFCPKPWTGFEVEHDGTVYPCCMARMVCGNVRDASVREIWNGPIYQEFRRKMAEGRREEICRPECPRLHGVVPEPVPVIQTEVFADNYEQSQAEIKARALILSSLPRFLKVTHSTLCNLDCIMCYQDRDDLRTLQEAFYEQIGEFQDCVQEIQVLGGEPFAIRRVRDFLSGFSEAQHPDAHLALVTNGTIHDAKTIEIVRNLRMSWMTISLDAATTGTYAHIRRKGDFANAIEGAKKWIAIGSDKGFPVSLAFTVMKDNVHEMPMFAELAKSLGVDCLFGTLQGSKGGQNFIEEHILLDSIASTRAVLESSSHPMPLAALTLSSLSPASYSAERNSIGDLTQIADGPGA